ncbi:PQQ-binding-like beta-propeller repeat protein [Kitasatospora sp. NPDC059673]|uniref:protein kinase domain-containing protein n=1 Tax=Kitasatospora sp. NPDC059673 TaxID=3346901 RepID=UPI0036B8E597
MHPLAPTDPAHVGPYLLLGRLGAGGMGAVYLGRSAGGRTVAIKLIRPELADDQRFRARFRREVSAARTASSAFTAPVVDADPDAPLPWLATAYIPGIPLDEAVRLVGPFPESVLRILAAGIAEELAAIHAAGLVHRDIKPSNVLLALDGPHVIDFGIARAADDSVLTADGVILGTPSFLSPEQALARPAGPAADVFSLGSTLVHAATGAGPFGGGHPIEVVRRVAAEEPDLSGVPAGLRLLVAACLAKDPADRPTPRQLVDSQRLEPLPPGAWLHPTLLAAVERSAAVLAPTLPPPPLPPTMELPPAEPESKRPTRRTLLYGLAGGAVALAGGGTAVYLTMGRTADKSATAKGGSAPAPDLTNPERSLDTTNIATALWTVPVSEQLTQIVGDGESILTVDAKAIRGFDRDGKPRWAPKTAQGSMPAPTLGQVVAANGKGYYLTWEQSAPPNFSMRTSLKAIDLASGETAWTYTDAAMRATVGAVCGVLDGTLYVQGNGSAVGVAGQTMFVWAVDTATRTRRWEQRYPTSGFGSGRLAVPTTGTHLLWERTEMSNGTSTLSGLDTQDAGISAWHQSPPGTTPSTAALFQTFTDGPHTSAGDHLLYLADRVYALNPADGTVAWKTDATMTYQAVVANTDGSTVFAAGIDYKTLTLRVQALNATDGTVCWAGTLPAGALVTNLGAQFADDTLYLWLHGKTWALDPATGTARWTYDFQAPTISLTVPLWAGGGRVYGPTEGGLTAVATTGKA